MTDLCGRCLIIVNATSYVSARWTADLSYQECARNLAPEPLAKWAEQILERSGGDAVFDIDATTGHIVPFSTWHGDPVCRYHLWVLVEADRKEHKYW